MLKCSLNLRLFLVRRNRTCKAQRSSSSKIRTTIVRKFLIIFISIIQTIQLPSFTNLISATLNKPQFSDYPPLPTQITNLHHRLLLPHPQPPTLPPTPPTLLHFPLASTPLLLPLSRLLPPPPRQLALFPPRGLFPAARAEQEG